MKHYLEDFANSTFAARGGNIEDDGTALYDGAYRIKTDPTKSTDNDMKAAAEASVKSDYNVLACSCIDVASDALKAGGKNPGTSKHTDIDNPRVTYTTISAIPNQRYAAIKENNYGTDVSDQIKPSKAASDPVRKTYEKQMQQQKQVKEQRQSKINKMSDYGPKY